MATDLSKSSTEQVIELIRAQNDLDPTLLTANDIFLVDPTPLFDHPQGKNTRLKVESRENTRYVGSVFVNYNRLVLDGLKSYGELTIEFNEGDELNTETLRQLNLAYGSNISIDEVTLQGLDQVDFDGEEVTITASPSSVAWIGSIELLAKFKQTQLNTILVTGVLEGLEWPIIVSPQSILFNNPGDHNFGSSFQLTAVASSGLDVVFSSLTPAVCSVTTNGAVTTVRAGECRIAANQPGDDYYYPAEEVIQTFDIDPIAPTAPSITGGSAGVTTVAVTIAPPANDGGSNITGYRVTSNPGNIVATGNSSPVTVTGLTKNTNYTFTAEARNVLGYGPASAASEVIRTINEFSGTITANLTTEGVALRLNCNPAVYDNKMWVTGTATAAGTNNALRAYDFATNQWVTGINAGTFGGGNNTSSLHGYNGKIYVNTTTFAYRAYTIAGNTIGSPIGWTQVTYTDDLTSNTFNSNVAASYGKDENIYVLSGSVPGETAYLGRLNVNTNVVTKLGSINVPEINGVSGNGVTRMTMVGNALYIIFSRSGQTPFEINVFYKFDLSNNTWTRLADIPTRIIRAFVVAGDGNFLYTYGGSTNTNQATVTNKIQKYDIALNTWSEVASVGTSKYYNGLAWRNSALYSYGGIGAASTTDFINEFVRIE